MKKVTTLVLMLCFILSGALCYAHGVARTVEKGDGVTIDVLEAASCTEPSRGNAIIPTINGHVLTVVFNENLGQVSVEVTTSAGASVQCLSVLTPNGLQVYIPNAGNYVVTFTLSNGDVFYGEFTVTD
ncbi:MAG: DUF3244 domain-containing protein [Bacteroidaceae bacterium]|nr:DUF3244 domain-containing protein [Bacteroidaceae bacterium]